jgi:hypothetical protein
MTGTKDSVRRPDAAKDRRSERLAAALRTNLKRRKEQVRARAKAGKPGAAAAGPEAED